jgi:hypothetical protein
MNINNGFHTIFHTKPYILYTWMNLSVFCIIHPHNMLHNDRAKSAEDIQNRMKNKCYRGLHVLLIQKYRLKKKKKKSSKSEWKWFLQTLHKHFFLPHGSTALVGLGLLMVEVSRTHSDTPHSVGLLCTRDRPVAQTSKWQHTTFTRDKHPCPWRNSNPQSSKWATADPQLRPRGNWDRPSLTLLQ